MPNCNFTFSHYRECLEEAKRLELKVEWIHDADHSLNNLLEFAKIEKSLGLKTKYFIRLHAKSYNALSFESMKILQSLTHEYNQDIGIHLEPWYYQAKDLKSGIEKEASLLSTLIDTPIDSLSIHSPAKSGTVSEDMIPNSMRYYCYDSSYYKNKKYLSDSGGRWREGCVCQHLGKHKEMIVLTHDLWWYNEYSSENY